MFPDMNHRTPVNGSQKPDVFELLGRAHTKRLR